MAKRLTVKQFAAGSCYSYVVSCGRDCLVIDPHISLLDSYASYIRSRKLQLSYIIDTHTHADHFSLAAVMKKKFGAPLLMSERAVSAIVNRRLKDGDEIKLGDATLKAIATPGHTDDAISLYGGGAVFTGDGLLIGSVGRTDFQSGSPESMFETLGKLKALPGATVVYPAHDYHGKRSSKIGLELRTNPFMKIAGKAAFVETMRSKVMPKPFNMDNIIRVNQTGQATMLEMVSPSAAEESAANDPAVKLLDVRTAAEYAEEHIQGAINIPLDILGLRLKELSESTDRYIVLCHTGNRSAMAADMLIQSGIHGVKILDGGMIRWAGERRPLLKGDARVSLERQVRMAAGSLVLAGVILSRLAHPGFILISAFVACGLIYSGISNSCMLGMLLMRLPYNRKLLQNKTGGGTCAMGG